MHKKELLFEYRNLAPDWNEKAARKNWLEQTLPQIFMASLSPVGRWWLLGAAAFLTLNGFFVARVPNATRPELAFVSAIFVVALAAPAFFEFGRWLAWRNAVLPLLVLCAYAIAIEAVGARTGFPYGEFSHKNEIGWKIFGLVPWTVPFAWVPLMLGTFALASRFVAKPAAIVVLSALFLVVTDAVLDPGAVHQGFWSYKYPGLYYGVPASNFGGWFLTGCLGSWLLLMSSQSEGREPPPPGLASSLFLTLVFWASVCLFAGLWIPGVLGVGLMCFLYQTLFRTPISAPAPVLT